MSIRKLVGDNPVGKNAGLFLSSLGFALLINPYFSSIEASRIAFSLALISTVLVILSDELKPLKRHRKKIDQIEDYFQYSFFVFALVVAGSLFVRDSDVKIKLINPIHLFEKRVSAFKKSDIDSLYDHAYEEAQFTSILPNGAEYTVCNCGEFKKHNLLKASVRSKYDEDRFFEFKIYCALLDECRTFEQVKSVNLSTQIFNIEKIPVDILIAFDPKLESQLDSFVHGSLSILDYSRMEHVSLNVIPRAIQVVSNQNKFTLMELLKGDFDGNDSVDTLILIAHNSGGSFTSYSIKILSERINSNMLVEI